LRRSNRLVVLVGLFLAVVAFIAVIYLLQGSTPPTASNETTEVVATQDIGIGVTITKDMVAEQKVPVAEFPAGAFHTAAEVINQVARQQILSGQLVTTAAFASGAASIECPQTDRCVAVQVDQVTGVGTLIQTGDYVDMIVAFNVDGTEFPVIAGPSASPLPQGVTPGNSTKLLLQGMQVVGTLLPTPTASPAPGASAAPNQPTLNGQQEIVILAVPAQYTEVIKFAQTSPGASISLALRSTKDFLDSNGQAVSPAPSPDVTTGVILATLVKDYGVLPPGVVAGLGPSPVP
jgi:pilus assembly protein CpaB